MNRKAVIIILSWLMVFFTMLIIYSFSEENAKSSAQTSGGVVKDVLDVFLPEDEITDELVKKYQFPFRKLAHFGIFMLLGFSFANAFKNSLSINDIYGYVFSFLGVIAYATFDEFHQNFTEGRGPSAIDVLIDSAGGLVGILIFFIMIFTVKKIMNKKIRQ